jgi:ribose transport system substrate-binding protein
LRVEKRKRSNSEMGKNMKKINIFIYSLLVLFMMFSFVIHNEGKSVNDSKKTSFTLKETMITATPAVPNPKFTIGWSVYNTKQEFFRTMQEGVIDKATQLGMNVITQDQRSSTADMISGVSKLIAQGIDALVISPFNPQAMPMVVDMAKNAGIPVIVVDIGTGGANVKAFIISDSFGGGVLAGEYALRLVNSHSITSKNIAIIKAEKTAEIARRRGEGFKRVMEDAGYKTVAEATANSELDQAYEAMKDILATNGDDLAVVFAENDSMAIGAAEAIEEAGKKGQILVIGFNGDPSAIEAIKEGIMQGTIAQQPYEMGSLGAELAYKLLHGEKITYDDKERKELYIEVYLINENGEPSR